MNKAEDVLLDLFAREAVFFDKELLVLGSLLIGHFVVVSFDGFEMALALGL